MPRTSRHFPAARGWCKSLWRNRLHGQKARVIPAKECHPREVPALAQQQGAGIQVLPTTEDAEGRRGNKSNMASARACRVCRAYFLSGNSYLAISVISPHPHASRSYGTASRDTGPNPTETDCRLVPSGPCPCDLPARPVDPPPLAPGPYRPRDPRGPAGRNQSPRGRRPAGPGPIKDQTGLWGHLADGRLALSQKLPCSCLPAQSCPMPLNESLRIHLL